MVEVNKSMRYSAVSASIIMIRRKLLANKIAAASTPNDYEILFLKRTEGTYAGGCFAFPGGKVEGQDLLHVWKGQNADLFKAPYTFGIYHDFNKRVAAIRELFEECNLLLA